MKSLILFVLTLIVGYSTEFTPHISISIQDKEYEKIYDIKITNDENHKIQNCENSEFVNLNGMYLKTIQNDIVQSDTIRHVSLSKNFLKKIPHNILNHVTHLLCLNLSHNSINLYEENQIQHQYLRVLDLSYQKMPNVNIIPEADVEIFDEKTDNVYEIYKHMIFNSTKIRAPNLEYLDLSGDDIATLLWGFDISFPKLIRLDLININADRLEPNFFNKVSTSLRVLHLENNLLRNLTLQNIEIRALYLDGNPLEQLVITSTNLRILSLSNCTNLSKVFLDMPYLEELDLSKNNLNNTINIRYDMFPVLRVLLLDYNKLSRIPILDNVKSLNELSLCYNMITHIESNSFQYLLSLKKLSLKGNKLDLDKETFSGLQKLEYLDLSENQLNYLSPDWALPLIKLQYLNMNSNHFATITDMGIYSITSLQHLFIKNNTFTKISTLEMEPLPDFITIYLV